MALYIFLIMWKEIKIISLISPGLVLDYNLKLYGLGQRV
jgi:hypothetical protein